MKRYSPESVTYSGGTTEIEMIERIDGEYVKADLAEGMLEVLKECLEEITLTFTWQIGNGVPRESPVMIYRKQLIDKLQSIIAKAEEH